MGDCLTLLPQYPPLLLVHLFTLVWLRSGRILLVAPSLPKVRPEDLSKSLDTKDWHHEIVMAICFAEPDQLLLEMDDPKSWVIFIPMDLPLIFTIQQSRQFSGTTVDAVCHPGWGHVPILHAMIYLTCSCIYVLHTVQYSTKGSPQNSVWTIYN